MHPRKHQQRGIVLPAAPAELGYHGQDFRLQFVGGQRAMIFQQTQQARFAEFLAAGLHASVTPSVNRSTRSPGTTAPSPSHNHAGEDAQHGAALPQSLVRAVGAHHERRIVAGVDVSQTARGALQLRVEKGDEAVAVRIPVDDRV